MQSNQKKYPLQNRRLSAIIFPHQDINAIKSFQFDGVKPSEIFYPKVFK
jgi:hypothetical protein